PLLFYRHRDPRDLHSFPTRRSSDLAELYIAKLTGAQVVPPTNSTATGLMTFRQALDGHSAAVSLSLNDLSSSETAAHIHSPAARSEEHTSELQSLRHLVCRLLLEKK